MKVFTHNIIAASLTALSCTASVKANIFKSEKVAGDSASAVAYTEQEYAINEGFQTFEKSVDTDSDGDLDIIKVSSNQYSTNLSAVFLTNNGDGSYTQNEEQEFLLNMENQQNIKLVDVIAKDLNNNGKPDLIFYTSSVLANCGYHVNTVSIYRNDGSNQFEAVHSYAHESYMSEFADSNYAYIHVQDMDNDGYQDFEVGSQVAESYLAKNLVMLNNHDLGFKLDDESMIQYVTSIKALDFDGDGNMDLAAATEIPQNCELQTGSQNINDMTHGLLWMNNGSGEFDMGFHDVINSKVSYLTAGDLDNDGFTDLLVTANNSDGLEYSSLYFGDSQASYQAYITLEDPVEKAEFSDLNSDGLTDLVVTTKGEGSQLVIYQNLGEHTFGIASTMEFENNNGTIIIKDMDNDGNLDLVINSKLGEGENVKVLFNEGELDFSGPVMIDSDAEAIVVTDVNMDGLSDVLANNPDHSYGYYQNMDNREFVLTPEGGIGQLPQFAFGELISEDLDSDGKQDLFGITREAFLTTDYNVRVLMHSDRETISYYNNNNVNVFKSARWYNELNSVVIDSADFDNDSLTDIVVSGGRNIILMKQIGNPDIEDIYYDNNHPGHGFSIDNMGRDNLYYTVFYTYDDFGNSEWYLQLNRMTGNNYGISIQSQSDFDVFNNESGNFGYWINYNYDYSNRVSYINTRENKSGYLENYDEGFEGEDLFFEFLINDSKQNNLWQSERLIASDKKPANDFSGLWWAGPSDSGWGISLNFVQRTDRVDLVAVLFFYDAQGSSRWLLGQAENFVPSQPLNMEMFMYNGYGREQNYVELTRVAAGNITLILNEASQNLAQSGVMSMNVYYPKGERRDWIRNNIPVALFSLPRASNN